MKKRSINLDIIRTLAVLLVICVHFLLNGGYYSEIIYGKSYVVYTTMRVLFMTCVPLFILLTGNLMINKQLSKKYYLGIIRILLTYFLCSIICFVFKTKGFNIISFIKEFLSFSAAPYAWYVNFYIGFFLIIPFLNLIYKSLKSRKQKLLLIYTLVFISFIPSLNSPFLNIFPNYWQTIYPLGYYFIGAYISEYKDSLSVKKSIITLIVLIIVFVGITLYLNYGKVFLSSPLTDYNGISSLIISTNTFIILYKLKLDKLPNIIKKLFYYISLASFAMYLVSYCFDVIVYKHLEQYTINEKLYYFIPTVLIIFIGSFVTGFIVEYISKIISNRIIKITTKNT